MTHAISIEGFNPPEREPSRAPERLHPHYIESYLSDLHDYIGIEKVEMLEWGRLEALAEYLAKHHGEAKIGVQIGGKETGDSSPEKVRGRALAGVLAYRIDRVANQEAYGGETADKSIYAKGAEPTDKEAEVYAVWESSSSEQEIDVMVISDLFDDPRKQDEIYAKLEERNPTIVIEEKRGGLHERSLEEALKAHAAKREDEGNIIWLVDHRNLPEYLEALSKKSA